MSIPATRSDIADSIRNALADGFPIHESELLRQALADGLALGEDPEGAIAEVIDDDILLPLAIPLLDDRWVDVPAFLGDRVFTHRVDEDEVRAGYLTAVPDLEPLTILTDDIAYRRLDDGSPISVQFGGLGAGSLAERGVDLTRYADYVWLLEADALTRRGAKAGDLIAVRVGTDGFEISVVTEPVPDGHDAAAAVAAVLAEYADEPIEVGMTVWQACADEPGLFEEPGPALTDLFDSAELVRDGSHLGPPGFDFDSWRINRRIQAVAEIHQLDPAEAAAVVFLGELFESCAHTVALAEDEREARIGVGAIIDGPGGRPGDPLPNDSMTYRAIGHLAEPAVAVALPDETIGDEVDGAVALGIFAEDLESRAPRAARANLRWLRGKALERRGLVLEAEAAFESALALDTACRLALFELARVASDRGDAERGLSLLQRADAPHDDHLVTLLEHFRPVDRSGIGRNDKCWCGSGRKHKVCHRGRETLPLADRAAWLYQKAGGYLQDGPWRDQFIDLAEIRSAHWPEPDAVVRAFEDPLVSDTLLFEGGAFAEFVHVRGDLLPEDELALAHQWLLTDRSVHEIESVTPGEGFTALDVRTGDRLDVLERTASRSLAPGALICARLVSAGDTTQCFGGIEPVPLGARDDLMVLLDSGPAPEDVVEFLSARFAAPVLTTPGGDPLVFCTTVLRTADPVDLSTHLDLAFDRVNGQLQWHHTVPVGAATRVLATYTLTGDELVVETMSERRMEAALGDLFDRVDGLQVLD